MPPFSLWWKNLIPWAGFWVWHKHLIDHKSLAYSVRGMKMRLYYTTDEKCSPIKHQRRYVFNGNEMIWRDLDTEEHKPVSLLLSFMMKVSRKSRQTSPIKICPQCSNSDPTVHVCSMTFFLTLRISFYSFQGSVQVNLELQSVKLNSAYIDNSPDRAPATKNC